MEVVILIFQIVWAILGIILFFKIWTMTNQVSQIRDIVLQEHYGIDLLEGLRVGDTVVRKKNAKKYVVTGVKCDDDGHYLQVKEGDEEVLLLRSNVLSLSEYENLCAKIVVGSNVKYYYYSETNKGEILSIDEDGICLIKDEDGIQRKIAITKLTPFN